ncbi:helix-turn-helix domain-containing protein [Streptomyces sp. NBC_01589]
MKKFKPQPGFNVLAHKLALDPNATASRHLHSHGGAARAAYNWAVAYVTAVWWQRKAEQSYGICEDELTQWRSWSLPSLRKAFNKDKRTNPRFADWWEENSKEAYNTGLAGASAAFDNYAKSKSGRATAPQQLLLVRLFPQVQEMLRQPRPDLTKIRRHRSPNSRQSPWTPPTRPAH